MPFSFVPATHFYPSFGGLGIYVKYCRGGDRIEVKASHPDYMWVKAPDRELLFVRDAHQGTTTRPLDCSFDEYVSLNPYVNSFKDFGGLQIKHMMCNYFQHTNKLNQSPRHRRPGCDHNGITYIADSGGFQIMAQKTEFIDPYEVTKWYNENTDLGIVLDIPASGVGEDILKRSAKVQRANTKVMLAEKEKHVELINVVHGNNIDAYKKFFDIVHDDEVNRLCMANAYSGHAVNAVGDMLSMFMDKDVMKHYKHYHILGVYNVSVIPLYIWLANHSMKDKLITSDASSYLYSALGHHVYLQRTPLHPPEPLAFGYDSGVRHSNPHRQLSCCCPVCKTVKYSDIFGMLSGGTLSFVLAHHNIYENCRYAAMMDDYARQLPPAEYREMMRKQLESHNSRDATLQAFDFIQKAETDGIKAARSRYAYYFTDNRSFQKVRLDDELKSVLKTYEGDEAVSDLNQDEQQYRQLIDRVLTDYEKLHKGTDEEKAAVRKRHAKKKNTVRVRKTFGSEGARFNSTNNARGKRALKQLLKKQARKQEKQKKADIIISKQRLEKSAKAERKAIRLGKLRELRIAKGFDPDKPMRPVKKAIKHALTTTSKAAA